MSSIQLAAKQYQENGYAIIDAWSSSEVDVLKTFADNWVYDLLQTWVDRGDPRRALDIYHLWCREIPEEHRGAFKAANRHRKMTSEQKSIVLNGKVREFLAAIGHARAELWDEGLGDIAFRFVRPGQGDGYPYCAKSWGPAKGVVSLWIPVIGFSAQETLKLAPRSHLVDHPRAMRDDKFLSEPRYTGSEESLNPIRPELRPGQVIFYHPLMLHSEDVTTSEITRLNLEVRIRPDS